MKLTTLINLFSLIILAGCSQNSKKTNQFTSLSDTLILETEKIKGYGMLPLNILDIEFQDTIEYTDFRHVYPDNVTDIKIATEPIDFKPWWYANIKRNKSDYITTFLKNYFPNKFDTLNIPSDRNNSISIMCGKLEENEIFIIDENNNKNFTDDSIRPFEKLYTKTNPKLIWFNYNIFNGEKSVEESGWINVGTNQSGILTYSVAHHLESTFSVDDNTFKIEVVNGLPFARFCFENPIIGITTQNGVKKDSLLTSEKLEKEEYLKLGNMYYRFQDVSNNGHFITLVKEKDVSNKIGTQVGFIAPDFKCNTTEGDTVSLTDFKGKKLLIVNVTSCWDEIMSYEYYKRIFTRYASKLDILGIDNSPEFLKRNIENLQLTGKFTIAENNKSIQNNYREDFCSRTCFLIDQEGRIIDKFEISDWEIAMSKHFN